MLDGLTSPPQTSQTNVPHGLPSGLLDFVGRSRAVADIAKLVEPSRVVTLTGPSGIGKTRLALEVAARLHDSYPAGGWFVHLAPVTDPELVPQAAVSAMGLEPEPGRDPADALCAHLRPRTALLILDNCEHVLEACAKLAERIADECNAVSIIATSQEALGITAEHTEVVPPLTLPDASAPPSMAAALESEAISLFCARAIAVSSAFRLTDEVLPPIAEICNRLDGIPLAIELAAARVSILGPDEIAERMQQRFRLLTQGGQGAPARHQTIRAALDWSYDLLTAEEATLFRRLSVFAGGAGALAVEDVCSGKGVDRDDVADLLTSLVAKSLVYTVGDRRGLRHHLLETIRAYGRQRLEEAEEVDAVSSRHATWCTQLVERSWHQMVEADPHVSIALLEADHDNLRAAMEWAAEADPRVGLRLASALTPFWKARGYFGEGRRWLTRMLDAVASASAANSAFSPPAGLRARAQWGVGMLATLQGDVVVARAAVEESLRLAREGKLGRAEAQALNLLGFISIFTQNPLAAKPLLEESVALTRASGDFSSLSATLGLLGRAHLFLGEIDQARAVSEECLSLDEDGPDRALIGLGWAAVAAGEDEKAHQLFERTLPLLQDAGERFETALVLSFLGELAWARADLSTARTQLEDGLELARSMGAPFPLVRCLAGLAHVAQSEGDQAAAARLVDEACELAATAHLPYAQVRSLHVRGGIRAASGDIAGSTVDFEEALSVARGNGDRDGVARSLRRLALVARRRGLDDAATRMLHETLAIQSEIGSAEIPSSIEAMAGMGADQGRPEHAARLFGAAEGLREGRGEIRRPDETAGYDADVAHLRSVLDAGALADAWAEGAALSRTQAVALAFRGRGARDAERPTSGLASLTATERQILDLVVEGLSNREIGERMFSSARTVQGHLSRMFPKLGVTSRRELRETWRRPQD